MAHVSREALKSEMHLSFTKQGGKSGWPNLGPLAERVKGAASVSSGSFLFLRVFCGHNRKWLTRHLEQ